MIEIRWLGGVNRKLQQRTREVQVDASGAFCGFTEWSEWSDVPIELERINPYCKTCGHQYFDLPRVPPAEAKVGPCRYCIEDDSRS